VTDAGYVVAAWVITGGVLGGYTVFLARRLKRAESEQSGSEPQP
jgi:CcmD family protein